jgi:hypothetical protein
MEVFEMKIRHVTLLVNGDKVGRWVGEVIEDALGDEGEEGKGGGEMGVVKTQGWSDDW